MRLGTSYMGHHNPRHIRADIEEMVRLGLQDVLVAAQENDFVWFPGKLRFTAEIARDHGLRPVAIFWGALNLFGGGRMSQFLLEHPEGFQVARDGAHRPAGCYVNPVCVARIKEMIGVVAGLGYQAYFVDEPTPLRDCFCRACRARYDAWYAGDLVAAPTERQEEFRRRCCVEYVREIASWCKKNHPAVETQCCVMPHDDALWEKMAALPDLDNLGTDLYWVNNDRDPETMRPIVRGLDALCRRHGKRHHQWLQCWKAARGREERIRLQGRVLVEENPDALYLWAWEGQVGTKESCEDPAAAWSAACDVLRLAREQAAIRS